MADFTLHGRVALKSLTSEQWAESNYIPANGEIIIYNDANNIRFKIGDGQQTGHNLPFFIDKAAHAEIVQKLEDEIAKLNLFVFVQNLNTVTNPKPGKIYIVKKNIEYEDKKDIYDEYVWNQEEEDWELIGEKIEWIDLSDYVTHTEMEEYISIQLLNGRW